MNKILLFLVFCFGMQFTFAQTKNDSIIIVDKVIPENFIIHSITNSVPNSKKFKDKYGIGYIVKGCVVDPFTMKATREHNLAIVTFLDDTYGKVWRKELPATPTGVTKLN